MGATMVVRDRRPVSQSPLILVPVLLVVSTVMLLMQKDQQTGANTAQDPSTGILSKDPFFHPSFHRHHQRHIHPPLWNQQDLQKSGPLTGVPILMLLTTDHLAVIRRSIESVLQETAASGMHLTVSVTDPSDELLSLLQQYPIKQHISTTPYQDTLKFPRSESFLGKLIPNFSLLNSFRNVLDSFSSSQVCIKDAVKREISVLTTMFNLTRTSSYRPLLKDLEKEERGIAFMSEPYNPMYRRAVLNSADYAQNLVGDGQTPHQPEDTDDEMPDLCQKTKHFKEALQFVLQHYPNLQYLMLMESGFALSPDFVSYFSQTVGSLSEDPSLYCVSATNPLASPNTSGNATRVYRVEHFVGGTTLIPLRLVNEILNEFVIYKETAPLSKKSALDWLEEWLTWWGQRRRRGCVVPDMPRACPLRDAPHDHTQLPPLCSHAPHTTLLNASRLLHYKYSQDLFHALSAAQPLGTEEMVNCSQPGFFPDKLIAEKYVMFIKLENYDDDFTFHHIMKCFGLDLSRATGYFEGLFRFTYRKREFLLLGIPYSNFSPSFNKSYPLITALIPGYPLIGQTQYRKFKDHSFNFSSAIIIEKLD